MFDWRVSSSFTTESAPRTKVDMVFWPPINIGVPELSGTTVILGSTVVLYQRSGLIQLMRRDEGRGQDSPGRRWFVSWRRVRSGGLASHAPILDQDLRLPKSIEDFSGNIVKQRSVLFVTKPIKSKALQARFSLRIPNLCESPQKYSRQHSRMLA